MHFTFGYSREVPVEIERKISVSSLVAIAILIILAVILFSFENIEEPVPLTNLTLDAPSSSGSVSAVGDLKMDSRTEAEYDLSTSGLAN
jgi:hypothetical protein